ncbi:hypothetical protein PG996_013666 [Apiospora saccharicola]|uniref:Uncharacterized protein n=1 Tax=Apiospora saccharicola TaxID=335842 RepID=A0ABR1U8E0_9PEZI
MENKKVFVQLEDGPPRDTDDCQNPVSKDPQTSPLLAADDSTATRPEKGARQSHSQLSARMLPGLTPSSTQV